MWGGGTAQFTRGSADEVTAYNVAFLPATVQAH